MLRRPSIKNHSRISFSMHHPIPVKARLVIAVMLLPAIVFGRPLHSAPLPSEPQIWQHILTMVKHGIRRPGYPADRWAEQYIVDHFQAYGLSDVHKEAVAQHGKDFSDTPEPNLKWIPFNASLRVSDANTSIHIPCFSVPFSASTEPGGLDLEIVAMASRTTNPAARGKIALYPVEFRDGTPHFFLKRRAEWYYDPTDSFVRKRQPPVVSVERRHTMAYAIASGARGYIGVIVNNPDPQLYEYYMPTFGRKKRIPGVYISERAGTRIRQLMRQGTVKGRLISQATIEPFVSYNVIGALKGKGDAWVVVSGHRDAAFCGAVEGGTSAALVLALAQYWAAVPEQDRPCNLLFMVTSGHLCGVTGGWTFPREHKDFLEKVKLQISLQNVGLEYVNKDGGFAPSGYSQARFWFVSPSATLMDIVEKAIKAERIDRSYIFRPDAIDRQTRLPNSDGAFFYKQGVPIVNLVSSPAYLFTYADGRDKVDRASLVPVAKAAIGIVSRMEGIGLDQLRREAGQGQSGFGGSGNRQLPRRNRIERWIGRRGR